jgi:hypothetical protein
MTHKTSRANLVHFLFGHYYKKTRSFPCLAEASGVENSKRSGPYMMAQTVLKKVEDTCTAILRPHALQTFTTCAQIFSRCMRWFHLCVRLPGHPGLSTVEV